MAYLKYQTLEDMPVDLRSAAEIDNETGAFKVEVCQKIPAMKKLADLFGRVEELTEQMEFHHMLHCEAWKALTAATEKTHYAVSVVATLDGVDDWCLKNCRNKFLTAVAPDHRVILGLFETKEDATLFKLFFG